MAAIKKVDSAARRNIELHPRERLFEVTARGAVVNQQFDVLFADPERALRDSSERQRVGAGAGRRRNVAVFFHADDEGVAVSGEYAVAGGPDGAAIWFRQGNEWTRARPGSSGWAIDKGPVADPNPSASRHTSGATGDGALYIGWSESTGSLLDDLGAPFMRRLAPDASAFGARTRAGVDVDDYVTSLRLEGRGKGLIVHYCGSDVDPLGVSSTDRICYVGLHPSTGSGITRSVKESDKTRYAFGASGAGTSYCSAAQGVRLLSSLTTSAASAAALDAREGQVAVWPCAPIIATEFDSDGVLLSIVEFESALYSPRLRAP